MNTYLKQLSPLDGEEIFLMLKSIGASENAYYNPVNKMDYEQYKKWLIEQDQWSRSENLPQGYVRQTIYWMYDVNTPVGVGKIRYSLTDQSREFGGNIGYAISKTYRGKGYGNSILKLLLEKAKQLEIPEILITVEKFNYASKAVAELNGGVLTRESDIRWYFNVFQ